MPKTALWKHVRAGLITLHVAGVCLASLPAPVGGLNRSAWSDPTVQAELGVWRQRLSRVGWSPSQREFEDGLFSFAKGWLDARRTVLRPFRPYFRYLGADQSWRMFVAPHLHPATLQVQVRVDGEWQTIYAQLDPEHAWRAEAFEHHRFRSALFRYSWKSYRAAFVELVDWIATQAGSDFPEATAVRVRWFKRRTPSPKQVRAGNRPEGKFTGARVVELERD